MVSFFERAFNNTRCVNRAWFGIHDLTTSLVVGGIFLAAIIRSGNGKGVHLFVDLDAPEVDGVEYSPVKSTRHSGQPLIWAFAESFETLPAVVESQVLWASYASASEKVLTSSTAASDRDSVQKKRKKNPLAEIWQAFRNPETCTYPEVVQENTALLEGAVRRISVNAYERNPNARKLCIDHFGPSCVVCGFNFQNVYGDCAEGYIHVHHLRQLSDIGTEYEVDPINDLCPVCPNCHAVIHFRDPPYTIEEVREFLVVRPTNRKPCS